MRKVQSSCVVRVPCSVSWVCIFGKCQPLGAVIVLLAAFLKSFIAITLRFSSNGHFPRDFSNRHSDHFPK